AGVHQLALTKLDVLDGVPRVRIATAYTLGGNRIEYFPARLSEQAAVQPVYEELEGWSTPLRNVRAWDYLPAPAVRVIRRVEELVQVQVSIVSTGPDRLATFLAPATG